MSEYVTRYLTMRRDLQPILPKGFAYASNEAYVLARGTVFESAALTEDEQRIVSAAMLHTVDRSFLKKQCYYNSQLLAIADATGTLKYVEGYAAGGIIPLPHGWCTINNKVVDVTWRHETKPIFGKFPAEWGYIGVVFDDTDALFAKIARTGVVQSQLDDFENGFPHLRA